MFRQIDPDHWPDERVGREFVALLIDALAGRRPIQERRTATEPGRYTVDNPEQVPRDTRGTG